MDLAELKLALDAAQVSVRAYSFVSDASGEVYRIAPVDDRLGGGWEIYYAERGSKSGRVVFRTETEACTEFLRWILNDLTTTEPARQRA